MAFMAGLGAPPIFDASVLRKMRGRTKPPESLWWWQTAPVPCLPQGACGLAVKLALQANDMRQEGVQQKDTKALRIASTLANQAKSQAFKVHNPDGSILANQIDLLRRRIKDDTTMVLRSRKTSPSAVKTTTAKILARPECPGFRVAIDRQKLQQMKKDLANLKVYAARGAEGKAGFQQAKANLALAMKARACTSFAQAEQKRIFVESGKVRVAFTQKETVTAAKEGAAEGLEQLKKTAANIGLDLSFNKKLMIAGVLGLVALFIIRPYAAPILRRV